MITITVTVSEKVGLPAKIMVLMDAGRPTVVLVVRK
jgi:hypothetical protein